MEGRIYISGAFTTVDRSKADEIWLDNDPHFWDLPPTWGICRTDYRRTINVGDYIFFVLPKKGKLPQMIYGYFCVAEKITHDEAFARSDLRNKKMSNKNPNGNIIVDAAGRYNRFDGGSHRSEFNEIKQYYVVGDTKNYDFFTESRIRELAPGFVSVLNEVFVAKKRSVFGVIGRSGRRMNREQVGRLLDWLR